MINKKSATGQDIGKDGGESYAMVGRTGICEG